jgi:N-acetylglutamate synthase-like GNAT family acetyltransferase
MRLNVFLEPNPARKRELHGQLTALLPDWFGQPKANAKYATQAEILDGYIAESAGVRRGPLWLKWIGPVSAEVFWMAVDPTCHRSGVGRALMGAAIEDARKQGRRHLFVMTLHPDDPYEPYRRNTRFYEAAGFQCVLEEQFPADSQHRTAYYLRQL